MPPLYLLASMAVGLIIGCYLNTLAYRLTQGDAPETALVTRDCICPACHHTLPLRDQIPILGYLLLGGRCRYCRMRIDWHYPLVEGGCAVLYGVLARLCYPALLPTIIAMLLSDGLIVLLLCRKTAAHIPAAKALCGVGLLLWYHGLAAVILGLCAIVMQ